MSQEAEARRYFDQKYNCAQSVLAPFTERFELDIDTAFKITTPFGGGMSHAGQVCGAVSGALMVIGLAAGVTAYDEDKVNACYEMVQEFQSRFQTLHVNVTCQGLLGLDISKLADLEKARELDLFHTLCPKFVGDATRIVGEMLEMDE